MPRRPFRLNPAPGRIAPALSWLGHALWHHVPVALFLACALSALGADFLRDTETVLMRGVYFFDLRFAAFFERAMVETQTQRAVDPIRRRPEISIVSLTPAAFSNYLLRTTPVPRARLACLIQALSETLPAPEGDLHLPPVVGIDIDITPPESKRGADPAIWQPTDDEKGCHEAFVKQGGADAPTVTALVVWAVKNLAEKHCVVAIAYPRPADTDLKVRDEFARAMAKVESPPACGGVRFASPDLIETPHEYVSEYLTDVLRFDQLPHKVQVDLGRDRYGSLPFHACSLGRVLGARLRHVRGRADVSPCLAPAFEDALLAVEPSAYETRRIRLGPARSAIGYSRIVPAKPTFDGDLLADSKQAFLATLQPSDLFVLTADSGTGADEFMVPVVEAPVPGAWVHAAVALTEFDTDTAHGDTGGHGAGPFVVHVAADLVWACFFALANAAAMRLARSVRNDVGREIAVAVTPAAVLVVFVTLALLADAKLFAAGEWQPHLLVLLGMALHTYVELAARTDTAGHRSGDPRADPVRRSVQWLWAAALWAFILLGVRPEFGTTPWTTVAASLVCGSAYLAAALRWPVIPLPWKVHAAHHAHSSPVR